MRDSGGTRRTSEELKVLIVDSSPSLRRVLRPILETEKEIKVQGEAENGLQAIEMAGRLKPDVIVMSDDIPDFSSQDAVRRIKQRYPNTQVVIVVAEEAWREVSMRVGSGGHVTRRENVGRVLAVIRDELTSLKPHALPAEPAKPRRSWSLGWLWQAAGALAVLSLLVALFALHNVLLPLCALLCGFIFFGYGLKYYLSVAFILLATRNGNNNNDHNNNRVNGLLKGGGLNGLSTFNGSQAHLSRQPFVSIHLPLYNEPNVVNRLLIACTSLDYKNYEVIVANDSTDETTQILNQRWDSHPRVKVSHRENREGFKGGALQMALDRTDPRAEFIVVLDADFIPPPDLIKQFLSYFFDLNGNGPSGWKPSGEMRLLDESVAVVQGYQWHILNASENWITSGIRSEFSGSYVVERSGQQIMGAMKMIAGSVFMMRADVLRKIGWKTSITEDWELTLRLYLNGYKVLYSPFIQAPAECVSEFQQLARQRMRWAEGHTFNVKKYFWRMVLSPQVSLREKLEFFYYAPYYLQSAFFLLGTTAWLLSEVVLNVSLPYWSEFMGWSLVIVNSLSLPLMNLAGLFLERGVGRSWKGILSFWLLSYLLAPYQAYAAIKGLLEPREGDWHRTNKTGVITEVVERLTFKRHLRGLGKRKKSKREFDLGKRLGIHASRLMQWLPRPARRILRRTGLRQVLATGFVMVVIILGFFTRFILIAFAAPDLFYLRDTTTNGATPAGEDMNIDQGSSEDILTFDSVDDEAYWYTESTYPTGDDDAGIAAGSYKLNMYFDQLPGWWDTSYDYRQNITISTNGTTVPSAYTVSITFNHEALVDAGQSQDDGEDIRITWWNGSGWTELDRFLDPGSSWNDQNTRIWFQTQAQMTDPGSDANYDMYYGNTGAVNPPSNPDNVFFHYDGFESGDFTGWDDTQAGSGDSITIATSPVHTGTYAAECYVDAGTNAYAEEFFTPLQAFHTTYWLYLPTEYTANDWISSVMYYSELNNQVADLKVWGETPPGSDDLKPYIQNQMVNEAYFSDNPLTTGVWHRLEIKIIVSSTSGRAELWVDGVKKVDESNINTGTENINNNKVGLFWSPSGSGEETIYIDDAFDRLWVDPEPSVALGGPVGEPSVEITVSVYDTNATGGTPHEIKTSSTVIIDGSTTDPYELDIGLGAEQTFTESDPRRLRVHIDVTGVNNGGSFTLAYDSAANPSNLSTPALTVTDVTLLLLLVVIFIPVVMNLVTRKQRLAIRLGMMGVAVIAVISIFASLVSPVSAAPDVFYLRDTTTNGATPAGEDMNTDQGSSEDTLTFDSVDDEAYWYTESTYPTGDDDAGIAAGSYSLNMYFDELLFSWYDPDWTCRKRITIDPAEVEGDLSDFPVLISFSSDSDLAAGAQDDGDDILFTSSNGTKLDHEIEVFNDSTGELVAWVKSDLSGSLDTDIYMYYCNLSVGNQENVPGVWDDNYVMVMHFNETSGLHQDSTQYGNHSTSQTVSQQGQDLGQIDGSDEFHDGSSNRIIIGGQGESMDISTAITIEAWVNEDYIEDKGRILVKDGDVARYCLRVRWGDRFEGYIYDGTAFRTTWGASAISGDIDGYVAFTWDGDSGAPDNYLRIYYYDADDSGVYDTSDDEWQVTIPDWDEEDEPPEDWAYIASHASGGEYFDGYMDEIRLSNIARSEEWLETSYNNQSTPSSFYKNVGSEETPPSVDITVSVYDTNATGGTPHEIKTSSTVTINSSTTDPYELDIGLADEQTFTSSDPRRLRVHIDVTAVSGGGSFTLAYDSAANPSYLQTPTLTVPDQTVILILVATLIPVLMRIMRKRRLATSPIPLKAQLIVQGE